jgi:hypothetical protein
MKLLTKELREKLPGHRETENVPLDDKIAVIKFFNPVGSWTWYAVEGYETEDGDFMFFGWVDGDFPEWGYFTLREMEAVKLFGGALGIERDIWFKPTPMKEIEDYKKRGMS